MKRIATVAVVSVSLTVPLTVKGNLYAPNLPATNREKFVNSAPPVA